MISKRKKKKTRTVLSLYTGAGGFDLGLEKAGFRIIGAVEANSDCRKTLELNRPKWPVAKKLDIYSYTPKELAKEFDIVPRQLTVLSAGPPCQPFSKSGYWFNGDSRRMLDPRAKTLHALLGIVNFVLPEVVLIENVEGIAFVNKDQGLRYILRRFKEINKHNKTHYEPQIFKLNAAEYGVPQIRERVFIIASRNGKQFTLPEPTHHLENASQTIKDSTEPALTAWEAIGNIRLGKELTRLKTSGSWTPLLPSIPEGKNYLWHTEKGGGKNIFKWRSRYWSFLLKLSKNKPSWTIQASPGSATGPFHWDNRKLSTRELATLQTFPNEFQFIGSYTSSMKQIGNAVPSAIGELFGLAIRKHILKERVAISLSLIPQRRMRIPSPGKTKPVPAHYKRLQT